MAKRSRDVSLSPADGEQEGSSDEAANMPSTKHVGLETSSVVHTPLMFCDLPPHREILPFPSYEAYEVHYSKSHTNRCSACGKNFPTNHFLNLHITENHDPVREALAARGEKTYGCFVEDCDRKCSTPQKRRLHMIDKHMFPKTYNFRIIDKGVDKADSMLTGGPRRRLSGFNASPERQRAPDKRPVPASVSQAPSATSAGRHTRPSASARAAPTSTVTEDAIDELEAEMSALKFVPTSVQLRQKSKS